MTKNERRQSLYAQRAAKQVGRASLAAAELAQKVVQLLSQAKAASRVSHRKLASDLEITEGRVSHVLNGDGNIHIATLARFMSAMGYDLDISAKPQDEGVPALPVESRRRRAESADDLRSAIYVYSQHFLASSGVRKYYMEVPADDNGTVALGGPELEKVVEAIERSGESRGAALALPKSAWTSEVRVASYVRRG